MAGSNSSCSPSSSAVTIPIVGKSILKRPPPVQSSLFSRITRFLPTQSPTTPTDDSKPLKRAHFILPEIAIVYPISSVNPPSTPTLKEEKRAIEDRELERRRRVVKGSPSESSPTETEEWWSLDKVEAFYRECCAGCDEQPDPAITAAFKTASSSNPRSVDFSGVQLTLPSASILSDVFTIEWGLRKVVFRECDLDEHSKSLQFLDISQNNLDKKSIEYIVGALPTAPDPGLISLRLDDCALRPAALETLSRAVRTSCLRNISLRHNRINATGAIALALMIRDYPDTVPLSIGLKGNDLRSGVTYVAQVLKRNRTLKVLNLSENKLDVAGLVSIAEALKYNSCLETLDLSKNPCAGPGLEGIQSLRTAFTLNNALKRLFLSSTSLTSAGAIALAEFLPESVSLLHLDLTLNTLDVAAVMALSSGLKANHVMRCLDLNIPPGDEVFAREILNSCVRNTEEAERASQAAVSGRGAGKGVWGMIEESELAKSIRLGEEKKIETDIAVRARDCLNSLTEIVQTTPSKPKSGPISLSTPRPETLPQLSREARDILEELVVVIQNTEDPLLMEELLDVNDQLTALLRDLPAPTKPVLTLSGLGIQLNGVGAKAQRSHNGHANGNLGFDEEDMTPTTPRMDKGKGRAEPEPVEHELVLSPTSVLAASAVEQDSEDDDSDEDELLVYTPEGIETSSPNDRSRSWVAEEGEVFRKGTVLLGPEEMEGEYAGEELRKELLEAMVERPPPRSINGDLLDMPGDEVDEPGTPTSPTEAKPTPRPYIPRSRQSSSNSILGVISPTIPASAPPGTSEFSLRGSPNSFSSPKSPQLPFVSGSSSPSVGIGPSLSRMLKRSPSSSSEESR
ncbi:hypothetical protein H0H93_016526 [Arthromyces matolae]|nr:hypothetical protein H0H93_016526 [Arthromyces matolae]